MGSDGRRNGDVAHFLDQLECLRELSGDELAELSEKMKWQERRWR